jgi:hypothetical protein
MTPTAEQQPAQGNSPQDQNRREVYARLYGGQSPEVPPSPTVQDTESPAQGEQVVAPVDPSSVTPPPDPYEERFSKYDQTLEQIVSVLSQLTQAPRQPEINPTPVAPTVAQPGAWLDLLREGKLAEADAEIVKMVAKQLAPQLKTEASQESLESLRLENELTSFVENLRRENPDLLPLEELITAKAQVRLEEVQRTGKIKSSNEFIAAYKDAVNKAADDARKTIQTIRATGKEDATIRNREVLSSSVVPPNAVDQNRQVTPKPGPVQDTTEDYLARRRAQAAKGSGLAAN